MVQIHRCPATVSGSKSAETTEVLCLGKVQRVGKCREPGDLPYMALRRPFEGKGRQLVCADPDRSWLGFFYACCFPCRVGLPFFPPCGGREERGEASRGSSRSLASLCPPCPCRNGEQRMSLDSARAHASSAGVRGCSWHPSMSIGRLPSWVYGRRDLTAADPCRSSVGRTGPPVWQRSTRPSRSRRLFKARGR